MRPSQANQGFNNIFLKPVSNITMSWSGLIDRGSNQCDTGLRPAEKRFEATCESKKALELRDRIRSTLRYDGLLAFVEEEELRIR